MLDGVVVDDGVEVEFCWSVVVEVLEVEDDGIVEVFEDGVAV